MNEVNIHWIIEIDRAYFEYSEYEDTYDVAIAASKNPYKYLADSTTSEYVGFINFIIAYCEDYGLKLEYRENQREKTDSYSNYLQFYNFNNETNNRVNLIIELRITDHPNNEPYHVNQAKKRAHKKYNAVPISKMRFSRVNIYFNEKHCHSYEDALDVLQIRLEEIDERYHFYNESED